MFSAKQIRMSLLVLSGLGLMIGFQNCSKVSVADPAPGAAALASSAGSSGDGSGSSISDGSPSSSSSSDSSSSSVSDSKGGDDSDMSHGGGCKKPPVQGGPVASIGIGDGSSISDGPESPACDAANMHKQYLLDQLIVNGMAQDLSSLKQHFQIQFIHNGKSMACEAMSIKVQGEGLCTAFHGVLLESQDPKTKVLQDLFSVQPASSNSSACKAGSLDKQVYDQVLNALNNADSVDFQANGQLVVKSGNVTVIFLTKHSQI